VPSALCPLLCRVPFALSESEQYSHRRSTEREVPDLESDDVGVGLLEVSEVAVVEPQADVVREVTHHAGAEIPAEIVLREVADAVECLDVLADPADAVRGERADSDAVLSADRRADDVVGHERHHARAVDVAAAA